VSDVLGGLALGWGWFLLVAIIFGGRQQRLGEPVEQAVESEVIPIDRGKHARKRVDA
jgi:hypothetical protein